MAERELLTEDWLRAAGFRWHQLERQPSKQWLLWLGDAIHEPWHSFDDLGVEVCENGTEDWFCWIRADSAGLYHRFLHVRHIRYVDELVRLIEGLTGRDWCAQDVMCGSLQTAERAHRMRVESERLDQRMLRSRARWAEIEKDESRGIALPEHQQGAIDGGKAS